MFNITIAVFGVLFVENNFEVAIFWHNLSVKRNVTGCDLHFLQILLSEFNLCAGNMFDNNKNKHTKQFRDDRVPKYIRVSFVYSRQMVVCSTTKEV